MGDAGAVASTGRARRAERVPLPEALPWRSDRGPCLCLPRLTDHLIFPATFHDRRRLPPLWERNSSCTESLGAQPQVTAEVAGPERQPSSAVIRACHAPCPPPCSLPAAIGTGSPFPSC